MVTHPKQLTAAERDAALDELDLWLIRHLPFGEADRWTDALDQLRAEHAANLCPECRKCQRCDNMPCVCDADVTVLTQAARAAMNKLP